MIQNMEILTSAKANVKEYAVLAIKFNLSYLGFLLTSPNYFK